MDYAAAKVLSDLPGRPRVAAGTHATDQLAEIVGGAGGRTGHEPKGILKAYRETYTVLQHCCQVGTVDELAPVWTRLARGGKGEQQSILQQELNRVCAAQGLTPDVYCPAVLTGLKQMVASLNFAGHGPDDLTAGCQPFLVTYTGTDDHYRTMDHAMVAYQLDQGMANASLADIREIREKKKVKLLVTSTKSATPSSATPSSPTPYSRDRVPRTPLLRVCGRLPTRSMSASHSTWDSIKH
jgi:hypothetical protein